MKLPISITPKFETPVQPAPPRPPLYMQKEDKDVSNFGFALRSCAPCPAVFVLKDDQHAYFDMHWQFFMRAINYGQSIHHVSATYGKTRAFFNRTGFPGRHNWLTGEDADQPDPNADKVRTCSRNVMTGIESYSLMQALLDTVELTKGIRAAALRADGFRPAFRALVTNNVLKVKTFDSRQRPPLKEGRTHPTRVEDINVDDYAITPRTHPEMFCVANIVDAASRVVPFPNGAVYEWTGDNTPYTFFPHIANHQYGDVLYPLNKLLRFAPDAPKPSPYRFL